MNFPIPKPPTRKLIPIMRDDLSRIEANTKLNSFVSHDEMAIEEKYKGSSEPSPVLVMATGQAPKIASKPKVVTYICTLPGGKKVEVRATSSEEAITVCAKRYKHIPVDLTKKPYERSEHLTTRPLLQNSDLVDLKKQLSRNGAK